MSSKDSLEILSTPEFLRYYSKEIKKTDIDPMLFLLNNNKFFKKLKH